MSFINKDLKLRVKNNKNMFSPLKQYLSGYLIQFIKFIFNTLKISVINLFNIFQVKESKQNIL